jgi:hypothetical protein
MHRNRSFTLLALTVLSLAGWAALRNRQRQRLVMGARPQREALQTWEGEGGGLPDAAPERGLNAPSTGAALSQRWSAGA